MSIFQKFNSGKIVIVDMNIPQLENNLLFNPDAAGKISHTLLPWCYLYERAKEKGIDFVTPDIYLKLKNKPEKAFLISHAVNKNTKIFINSGVVPLILISQESPIVDYRFYFFIKKYSSIFKYVFLFEGCRNRIDSLKTIFNSLYFPQPYSANAQIESDFRNKKYLAMISGNKRSPLTLKRFFTSLLFFNFYKELYKERLEAIKFFSQYDDFDLYGIGWDKSIKENKKYLNEIKKCYRGAVKNKIDVLKKYRFSLVFENTIFKGYVTEKIFDAFFAGSVPIYFGAPDITDYIPENTFIDFRKFGSYFELDGYLREMDESTYKKFIKNINLFIKSEKYYKFSQEKFANDIISIIDREFSFS